MYLRGEPTHPDIYDLPWDIPLEQWPAEWLIGLPRGISRHVVRLVGLDGVVAVKEIGQWSAERDQQLLRALERASVPCVHPVGIADGRQAPDGTALQTALLTQHLEFSLPHRALLSQTLRPETAVRLLDALSVLLVRLHLAGFWWGDCSLSNTLFRRDAGSFSAYQPSGGSSSVPHWWPSRSAGLVLPGTCLTTMSSATRVGTAEVSWEGHRPRPPLCRCSHCRGAPTATREKSSGASSQTYPSRSGRTRSGCAAGSSAATAAAPPSRGRPSPRGAASRVVHRGCCWQRTPRPELSTHRAQDRSSSCTAVPWR